MQLSQAAQDTSLVIGKMRDTYVLISVLANHTTRRTQLLLFSTTASIKIKTKRKSNISQFYGLI
jgi:hypothetical protein